VVVQHLQAGGQALVLAGDMIEVRRSGWSAPVVDVRTLPFTLGGRARHNVQNALAAAAALLALDESPTDVAVGLQGFQNSAQANPLRFNLFNLRGVQVVVDYAHNAAAYRALADSVRRIAEGGRVVAVVSAPGDRRDAELEDVGRVCAQCFDELVFYELDEDRGRPPGATLPPLLRGARRHGGAVPPHSRLSSREALAEGLKRCRPGDTLVFGCATDLQELFDVTGLAAPAYVEPGLAVDRGLSADRQPPAAVQNPPPCDHDTSQPPSALT
jgi:cyanophycin synthetase